MTASNRCTGRKSCSRNSNRRADRSLRGLVDAIVLVPAGTFRMGSPDDDREALPSEKPQHEVTIAVDEDTMIQFGGHREVLLSELAAGDVVRVYAVAAENGLLAVKIKVLDDDGRYDEFEGTIVGVTGSVLTIENKDGTTVDINVTSQTQIRHRFDQATIADLQPGVVIEVTVRRNADGSFDALFIAIEDRGDEDEVEIKGTVVSATDTSVTVQRGSEELTVQFNHETEFKRGTAEDLVAGQKVEIEAIRRRDGTMLAKKIEIED